MCCNAVVATTLDQWIASSGHRKNLLMPGRVGVGSAKSWKDRSDLLGNGDWRGIRTRQAIRCKAAIRCEAYPRGASLPNENSRSLLPTNDCFAFPVITTRCKQMVFHSVCVALAQDLEGGLDQDLEVEP